MAGELINQEGRCCVTDLAELVRLGPSERIPIGKGLEPRDLAEDQSPGILGYPAKAWRRLGI